MSCRHVKTLVDRVRTDSNFPSIVSPLGTNVGVQDSYIVDLFNDAKDEFVAEVAEVDETNFQGEADITLSESVNSYDPARLAANVKIINVKHRYNNESVWFNTPKKSIWNVSEPTQTVVPIAYYLKNGTVYFEGSQLAAQARIIWEQRVDYLAIPVGTVGAVTDSGTQITALTIGYDPGFTDADVLQNDLYLCIADKDGNITMRNLEYSSVSSGVLTMSPFTYQPGESVAIADKVCIGRDVTTHSDLPREAEMYFISYATEHVCGTKGASFEKQTFLRRATDRKLQKLVARYLTGDKNLTDIEEVDDELMLRSAYY